MIKDGFNIGNSQTHIVPIIIGNSNKTILISKKLENKGLYVVPIRPPSVNKNSSRLRISLSSLHTKKNIKKLITSLNTIKNKINLNE